MKRRYYQIAQGDAEASIFIYGDIMSLPWEELGDVSANNIAKEIEALSVDKINVFINSYGGEVKEGLAIYNVLKRHKAKVTTYCDGFACSAASVVFMAGDERIMSNASLLMIHNAWLLTTGDQNQLRKDADDLETITQASVNAYMACVNITEKELKVLMDAETWLDATNALEKGFATSIVDDPASKQAANQSVKKRLISMILTTQREKTPEPTPEPEPEPPEPEQDPEPTPEPKPVENRTKNMFMALFGQRKDEK